VGSRIAQQLPDGPRRAKRKGGPRLRFGRSTTKEESMGKEKEVKKEDKKKPKKSLMEKRAEKKAKKGA
jgi:hypothetical protein